MKLKSVKIDNYRAIEHLRLPLDPELTVLHGANTCGKTSVLNAIAVGLGVIPDLLPDVSGIDFLETDLRAGESFAQVKVTTTDDDSWKRERSLEKKTGSRRRSSPAEPARWKRERSLEKKTDYGLDGLKHRLSEVTRAEEEARSPVVLPIVAFYDTNRVALAPEDMFRDPFESEERRYALAAAKKEMIARIGRNRDSSRVAALKGALSARTSFPELFTWFYAKENDELRDQKQRHDFGYRRRDLSAVRNAITSMVDGVSDLHVDVEPLRFSVSVMSPEGLKKTLELDPVERRTACGACAGRRSRLADGAGQSAPGRPARFRSHRPDRRGGAALHPSWQQRILNDLRRTFPNTQFIVSTHSPQVLTTVEPEHIVELVREDSRIVAGSRRGLDLRRRGRRRAVGRDARGRAAGQQLHEDAGPLPTPDQRGPGRIRASAGAQGNSRSPVSGRSGPGASRPRDQATPVVRPDGEVAMKRIRVLAEPTRGLQEYHDSVDNPSWDEFCSHNAGASLRELRDTLARNQHELCAYCEIDIRQPPRQLEHVVPRSDAALGERKALDVANLVACCLGGTVRPGGPRTRRRGPLSSARRDEHELRSGEGQ